jgi:hypothetical protein
MALVITPHLGGVCLPSWPGGSSPEAFAFLTHLDKACYTSGKILFPLNTYANGMSTGIEWLGGMYVIQRLAGVQTVICSTAPYASKLTAGPYGADWLELDITASLAASAWSSSTIINAWYTEANGYGSPAQTLLGEWYDGTTVDGLPSATPVGGNAYPPPACGTKPTNYTEITLYDDYHWSRVKKP